MTYSDSVKRTRTTAEGRGKGVNGLKRDVLARPSYCRFSVFSKYSHGAEDREYKNCVLNKMTANGMLTQPSISREEAGLGLIQK